MQRVSCLLALMALLLGSAQASAQSALFDFEDGTDQGFGLKFSNDASFDFPIVNIGGSNRMGVARTGEFQEADINSGDDPYLAAFNAAVANPSSYLISYDWYIDTSLSPGNYGSFLQLGTYINAGQGSFPYAQDFPDSGKDVELDGTQLASGQVFSGTVSETIAAKYAQPLHSDFLGAPSQRFGFIINGDGADATVYFDNIRIHAVPEPAALILLALAAPALLMRRK